MEAAYDEPPGVSYDGPRMSRDDREHWEAKHRVHVEPPGEPSRFLVEHAALLCPGRTLDLAAGTGRNTRFLAARGHMVVAVDVAAAALTRVRGVVPAVACVRMDLDAPGIRPESVDNVVVVSFLDRRLFTEVPRWLRPGGVLLWDTFLVEQREIGHPRNPAYLLRRGELLERLSTAFHILASREGLVDESGSAAFRSAVVARRL
jgi:tellurite methyltransferase